MDDIDINQIIGLLIGSINSNIKLLCKKLDTLNILYNDINITEFNLIFNKLKKENADFKITFE